MKRADEWAQILPDDFALKHMEGRLYAFAIRKVNLTTWGVS